METALRTVGGITYSSYCTENRAGEQFISDHTVGYILSGTVTIIDGDQSVVYRDGDVMLFRRTTWVNLSNARRKAAATCW